MSKKMNNDFYDGEEDINSFNVSPVVKNFTPRNNKRLNRCDTGDHNCNLCVYANKMCNKIIVIHRKPSNG